MKKRLVCLALALLLLLLSGTAMAQTAPAAHLLFARYDAGQMEVTYRVLDPLPEQQMTCLIYARTQQGKEGDLLQIDQWSVDGGIHTRRFAVTDAEYGYIIRLGGAGMDSPKSISFARSYTTAAWVIQVGQTTERVKAQATHITDVSISRQGKTVTPGDVVLPGDAVTGIKDGQPLSFWAVVPGDVDLDGKVNAADALQVLRHAVGKTQLSQASLAAADFAQSGKIDAGTALSILKFAVGKLSGL